MEVLDDSLRSGVSRPVPIVSIEGTAGTGKTSLVNAFRRRVFETNDNEQQKQSRVGSTQADKPLWIAGTFSPSTKQNEPCSAIAVEFTDLQEWANNQKKGPVGKSLVQELQLRIQRSCNCPDGSIERVPSELDSDTPASCYRWMLQHVANTSKRKVVLHLEGW